MNVLARIFWFFRKKTYQVQLPEKWAEVSEPTFWKLLWAHMAKGQLSQEAFEILLLKHLTDLPFWVFNKLPAIDLAEQLLPRIAWAKDLSQANLSKENIRINGQLWRIPAPLAKDMPLQQYFLLEKTFSQLYAQQIEPSAFLAALLRPVNKQAEARYFKTGLLPVVSPPQLKQYAQDLQAVAELEQVYLLQHYANMRTAIRQQYPHIHSKEEKQKPESTDWDSILPRIAELGIFGPLDKVKSTPTVSYLAWANAQHTPKESTMSLQDMIKQNHQKFLN
jgi:hypothetical protein